MERAILNAPFTARITIYSGSSASDPTPDTATIHVIRADGTDLVPAGTATINDAVAGPGVFAFNFTASQMNQVDVLECLWTVTVDGMSATFTTIVEVAGGYLCTLAELRAVFPSATDRELANHRVVVEQMIEDACGRAFVPRLAVEEHQTSRYVRLQWAAVRRIRYVTIGTAALSQAQVDGLYVTAGGRLVNLSIAAHRGLTPMTIAYEHGMQFVPDPIRSATAAIAQQIQSAASTADVNANRIIRREADNQVVAYATPSATSSSTATTISPLLAQVARDYHRPLVA